MFNLGTGDGFSVRQVIDQAKHVTNRPVPVTHGARRPGDCTKLVSGSLRAKTELGWSADRSNLKQMITDAWRWHQNVVIENNANYYPQYKGDRILGFSKIIPLVF